MEAILELRSLLRSWKSIKTFLPFPTLPLLALFGPKVLWSHPTSIMVAAHTRKTLDPCLHIWLSTIINKDNVAARHRALAPIVHWVPNDLYGPHTLVGAGSHDYLWHHVQSNSALFPVWCTWTTAVARLLPVPSLSDSVCCWRNRVTPFPMLNPELAKASIYWVVPSAQISCPLPPPLSV